MNLITYGWNETWQTAFTARATSGHLPARVITMYGERYEVITDEAKLEAQLAGRLRYDNLYAAKNPTIGDWVIIQPNPWGAATIVEVLPRQGYLERRAVAGRVNSQVIAANIDRCLLLQAFGHDLNPARLDRYVTMAWNAGITPLVLLSKADTVSPAEVGEKIRDLQHYLPGVDILAISSHTGYGIDCLLTRLQPGMTIVALGSSGVGKSTLLNYLMGSQVMPTAEVRAVNHRGRHITTHRQMFLLPTGILYIDTPGMRLLKLFNYDSLDQTFQDIQALAADCRFSDCTHQKEPECAVRIALTTGELSRSRWQSYLKLKQEELYQEQRQILLTKQVSNARKKRNKIHYSDHKRGIDRKPQLE